MENKEGGWDIFRVSRCPKKPFANGLSHGQLIPASQHSHSETFKCLWVFQQHLLSPKLQEPGKQFEYLDYLIYLKLDLKKQNNPIQIIFLK